MGDRPNNYNDLEIWTDPEGRWFTHDGRLHGPYSDDEEAEIALADVKDQLQEELAAEFTENGLEDVAEHLRDHGIKRTREWIDGAIEESRRNDDPESWRLGNLEVARDHLETAVGRQANG